MINIKVQIIIIIIIMHLPHNGNNWIIILELSLVVIMFFTSMITVTKIMRKILVLLAKKC